MGCPQTHRPSRLLTLLIFQSASIDLLGQPGRLARRITYIDRTCSSPRRTPPCPCTAKGALFLKALSSRHSAEH